MLLIETLVTALTVLFSVIVSKGDLHLPWPQEKMQHLINRLQELFKFLHGQYPAFLAPKNINLLKEQAKVFSLPTCICICTSVSLSGRSSRHANVHAAVRVSTYSNNHKNVDALATLLAAFVLENLFAGVGVPICMHAPKLSYHLPNSFLPQGKSVLYEVHAQCPAHDGSLMNGESYSAKLLCKVTGLGKEDILPFDIFPYCGGPLNHYHYS